MAELSPADHADEYRLGFAGDTFNTAWYLARLCPRAQVSYLSGIGTDTISERMRAAMTSGGIDTRHLRVVPDRTVGLYMISLENGERSFCYWRGQSAARCLADDPGALAEAMSEADVIYLSGITLAILQDSARAALLAALRTARASGKKIAFDPNLRPRLWTSGAEMTRAIMQGATVSDIVLPSFEDEAQWFGDIDPDATVDRYVRAGVASVIVKNGALPVHFRHHESAGIVAVPPLPAIVDTTAAGDSFNAGYLSGRDAGLSTTDAIAIGCRLAGQVVQGKGALVAVDATDFRA